MRGFEGAYIVFSFPSYMMSNYKCLQQSSYIADNHYDLPAYIYPKTKSTCCLRRQFSALRLKVYK